MSDIRFNQWLHQSGTGGVSQDHIGNIGIGTTNPSIVVSAANTAVLNVGVITANNLFVNNAFNGDITGNVTGNISGATGTFSGNVDIADKIIHTGDTDTAMRFPADNTFAVDTAGVERLRITSSGVKQVKNGNLNINSTYIDFSGDVSTPSTAAAIFRPADNTLAFSTANTERFRIKSNGAAYFSGNLGLGGQTSPSGTIHINDLSANGYELKVTGNAVQFNRSSNSYIDQLHDSGSILFRMGSSYTEAMRITSDGKVSISSDGTAAGLLTIKGNSDEVSTPSIRLLDGSDTREVSITNTSGDFVVSTHGTDDAIHGRIKIFESGVIDFDNGGASGSVTNRLRIQPSGYVGIGEASPGGRLTVKHANTATSGLNATLKLKQGVATNGNRSSLIFSSLDDYDVAAVNGVVEVHSGTSANNVGRLEFWTKASGSNAGERLRIESSGRVVIHGNGTIRTSWPGAVCSVNNLAMVDAGSGFSWGIRGNSGDTQWCLERIVGTNSFSDSNIKFRVYNNGNYSFAGSSTSDRDIKENIEDISGTSLNLIDQLRPRTFNFKESEGYSTEPKTGFIAQEIGAVIPSIVNGTDGQKDMGVDYNGLVAHLVKAVQELKAENDSLRSRLDTAGL